MECKKSIDKGEYKNIFMTDRTELTGYPSIDKPWLKYYDGADLTSKPFDGSVYEHIYLNNKDFLDKYALEYFGRKIKYGELFQHTETVANALVKQGIKEGDNVILLMSSCPEMVYLLLALNKIGAVANMINPLFTREQIRDRINDTDASMLFVLDQLYGLVKNLSNEICIKKTVVIPITRSMPSVSGFVANLKLKKNIDYTPQLVKWDTFISEKTATNIPSVNNPNLAAIMVYSSGTTGASKGIVLMNKGINAIIDHYESTGFEYKRNESFLQIIPTWFSTGSVICLLMPLCIGVYVILEPVFSGKNFTNDILKYKPNTVVGATSQWLFFLKSVENKNINLSYIKYPIAGGEKLLLSTENELNKMLRAHGCTASLINGYGMCELGSVATFPSVKYSKPGAAGYPIKNAVVAAFDTETNAECKYNERGEIRVLTPARMKEYYKRPDATAEFFRKDAEGREWGCTGDVGFVDQDGFVFVEGRATDYFITASGQKTYCFDIENVLLEDNAVDQCEIVSVKTESGYDKAFGFVVGNAEEFNEQHLLELCRVKFNPDQVPVAIKQIDKFPVASSGKRNMEELKRLATEELSLSFISEAEENVPNCFLPRLK